MLGIVCEQGTSMWKMLREDCNSVAASDVAKVLYVDPFTSHRKYYMRKLQGEAEQPKSDYQQRMLDQGHATEQVTAQTYMRSPLGMGHVYRQPGTLSGRPGVPLRCSPDLMEFDAETGDFVVGIEIKTLVKRLVPLEPSQVYPEHVLQCVASALVVGTNEWRLVYSQPNCPHIAVFDVSFNEQEVAPRLLPKIVEFIESVLQQSLPRNKKASDTQFVCDLLSRVRVHTDLLTYPSKEQP